jgi:nucleotide-binding universal stress UspA family protein
VEEAVEAEAQLLVVGAVGHGLTRRFFVGSVAERTAEASPIPTLVIRPGSRLGSWLAGRHPLKVLLGYDFSAASDAALQWVHRLQSMGSCEIRVVHVDWPPDEASRLGYQGPLPLARNPQEIQSALERDLVERVKMFLPNDQVTIEVHPGWGHPEGSLFDIANRQQVDLVVVGTNRRHGLGRLRFGSVSRAVLHHATVPVAVVPPPSRPDRGVIPKFERVLAVTDFSPLGNRAIPYARALLHRGGTLKLIHVLESSARAGTARKAPAEKEHQKILGSLRALLPKEEAADIHLEVEVLAGKEVARTIQQESERFHADAICLGSHGRSGLARTVLGSIAQEVISGSRRPVLVVRS